jgi:2-dehydro-3-deoxyphosphooctonate aldolase (KDO 8-P synthase)
MKTISLEKIKISNNDPFVLISGPCQIESMDHSLFMADSIMKICDKLNISFIFKSSFDKANRTSAKSTRGVGLSEALKIFSKIKSEFGCPVLTDVHKESHCEEVKDIVDILQIPAFLCRQTDLIEAAAKTGKVVNIKKGQFLAPWDVKNIIEKSKYFGNDNVMITDRGTSFGYNTLISDMRGLDIMREFGAPIIYDATHSVQQPGGMGGTSGGDRKFVPVLGRAALAATKIAGIFAEVHQDPDNAPSDGPCMLELRNLENTLKQFKEIDNLMKR